MDFLSCGTKLAKLYKLWLFEQTVSISMKVSGNSGRGASYARLYIIPSPRVHSYKENSPQWKGLRIGSESAEQLINQLFPQVIIHLPPVFRDETLVLSFLYTIATFLLTRSSDPPGKISSSYTLGLLLRSLKSGDQCKIVVVAYLAREPAV